MENQNLMTIAEIVEKYKISRQTIMRRVDKGYITALTLPGGRKLFFREEDVQKLFSPKK